MIKMDLRKKKENGILRVFNWNEPIQSKYQARNGNRIGFPSERIDGMRMWEFVEIPIGLSASSGCGSSAVGSIPNHLPARERGTLNG